MDLTLKFTEFELHEFIVQYYPNYSTKVLSIVTKFSIAKVYRLAEEFGVKKSDEFIAEQLKEQAVRLKTDGIVHRFKKGHTPANKGKKMPEDAYKKCKATMFKKGNKPPNYSSIGTEVITEDGYIKVKIADPNVWELKHRLVWQKANGEIPKGFNVQFKDRNKLNTQLENLYIISRSQQIDQNTILRYPVEIRDAIRTLSKLTKTIKQYETD